MKWDYLLSWQHSRSTARKWGQHPAGPAKRAKCLSVSAISGEFCPDAEPKERRPERYAEDEEPYWREKVYLQQGNCPMRECAETVDGKNCSPTLADPASKRLPAPCTPARAASATATVRAGYAKFNDTVTPVRIGKNWASSEQEEVWELSWEDESPL